MTLRKAVTSLATASVLAIFAGVGCAADPLAAAGGSEELRALKKGDIDVVMGPPVAASPPPSALTRDPAKKVVRWDLHYVIMPDSKPQDRFTGVLAFAKDAAGATRFLVPIKLTDDGGTEALFFSVLDESNPKPVALDTASKDPKVAAVAIETTEWLQKERQRLAVEIRKWVDSKPSAATTDAKCYADVAVYILALASRKPVVFFAASAVVDAAFGHWAEAGMYGSLAGTTQAVHKFGWEALARLAGRATSIAFGGYVIANVADKGLQAGLVDAVVPSACKNASPSLTAETE